MHYGWVADMGCALVKLPASASMSGPSPVLDLTQDPIINPQQNTHRFFSEKNGL